MFSLVLIHKSTVTNVDNTDNTIVATKEDEYIASISDPQSQTEHRWQKSLKKSLKQLVIDGALGDNIAMQAISHMLSVTITVTTLLTQILHKTIVPLMSFLLG